jgi:hypothetical protein
MKQLVTLCSALLCLSACDSDSTLVDGGEISNDVLAAAASITESDYLEKIGKIAHDSMGGRNTPSVGLNKTADWIAQEFATFGLAPGGDDGSFLQYYPIETLRPDRGMSSAEIGGQSVDFGEDIVVANGVGQADIQGEVVVLAGSGDVSEDVASSINGKIVLSISMEEGYRTHRRAISDLRRAGALAVLVATEKSDQEWTATATALGGRNTMRIGSSGASNNLAFEIRDEVVAGILTENGMELNSLRNTKNLEIVNAGEMQASLSPRSEMISSDSAPNVVGILEGSDPDLKDEYIAYSAHMDHVGVGNPNSEGDSIYNGADDDASGTIGIVEIAQAFASMKVKPKRSSIFLLVSGEEKGLWGSAFFADNPPVPVDQIVANLNADMIGRNWSDTVVVIGKEHSDLGATLNQVSNVHPELGLAPIDDIWPEERFYFRSDHYNFAQKGIPILFFFSGVHEDYHQPSDEVDLIDTEKAARISKMIFYLGNEVANNPMRPEWNPDSYQEIVVEGAGR